MKTIYVTKADIENGIVNNIFAYPVALALRRRYKQNYGIFVSQTIVINKKHYSIPNKAQKFIAAFDNYDKVKPFKFRL